MLESTLPTFSVITVSYNQGEFIRDTIDSVLHQHYPNFEHIIVDAGSTDTTLDVIRGYPHLKWTSEPDRGQSHGLNKGFARAKGDIVAWINSDDWYAPGAFYEVANLMQHSPIVIGSCIVTDRKGNPTEEIPNISRTWFDALKYWVYHSIPPQPGIFFRRELFAEIGADPATALDESLEYTMDYDLWMRILEKHPLNVRTPKVLSYMRNYESNKTGAYMASAYREMSRVFRRHSARRCSPEQLLSFVLPLNTVDVDLRCLVAAIAGQTIQQCELLCVEYSGDRNVTKTLRAALRELESEFPTVALRCQRVDASPNTGWIEAVNFGMEYSRAPYAVVMSDSRDLPAHFASDIINRFATDNLGFLFASLSTAERCMLFSLAGTGTVINPVAVLQTTLQPGEFTCRKVAWMDCGGFAAEQRCGASRSYCMKRLLLQMVHKAWSISFLDSFYETPWIHRADASREFAFRLYENCEIVDELASDVATNTFTAQRQKNGFALSLPEELWQVAKQVLSGLPNDFSRLSRDGDEKQLSDAVVRYPENGVLRICLAEVLQMQGKIHEAQCQMSAWNSIHSEERQSPLFGGY